ncbi:hypothetical protein HK104_003838 [Borealophlyctis nickersoniae]|nr:hypothetical protein HK104_003838 [Borealophlyctis nickersoniae]
MTVSLRLFRSYRHSLSRSVFRAPTLSSTNAAQCYYSRRHFQFQPLRIEGLKKDDYKGIAIVAAVASLVIGCDIYYYFVLHRKPLVPDEFRSFELRNVTPVNHDTSLFEFDAECHPDKFPIPSYVIIKDDTCQIARPYTPIKYAKGHFLVLIKKYPEGSVSKYVHSLGRTDRVQIRGPIPSLPYRPNVVQEMGMVRSAKIKLSFLFEDTDQSLHQIAGGTGIAPMYQLINRILSDPEDKTRISLIYANKSFEDILLRKDLDRLSQTHPNKFKVFYTVEKPPKTGDWKGGVGFINEQMLRDHLPKGEGKAVLVCGPEGMMRHIAGTKPNDNEQGPLRGLLKKLGYEEYQVFKF